MPMEQPPVIVPSEHWTSKVPLWLAVGANVANFLLSIRFYSFPSGIHVRPMMWAFWVSCIAAGGFSALLLALPVIRRGPRRFRSWITLVLALTPLPLASAMLHHAARVRGFFIAP